MKRILIILLLLTAIVVTNNSQAMAQGNASTNPELIEESNKLVSNLNINNEKINASIGNNELFCHKVNFNALGQTWMGLSQYDETIYFYFEMKGGRATLKKAISSNLIISRTAYTDVYFENSQPALVYYNPNVNLQESPKERYYFSDKKLIGLSKGDNFKSPAEFSTEDIKAGIDIYEKTAKYQRLFEALVAAQYNLN